VLALEVLTLLAGVVAGALGAMLGLGGGIFLVPFIQLILGQPLGTAAGVSLVTVIGTSLAVSTTLAGRELINLRLALVMQLFTSLGATTGAALVAAHVISDVTAERVFGMTAVVIAIVMVQRLEKRNVLHDTTIDIGRFGARFHDEESGAPIAYRLRRTPLAFGVSYAAGIVSTITGVGGGILIVPVLNSLCGVPIRAAAATSTLIIGVTAVPGVLARFPREDPGAPALAAAAVLGVLLGSRLALKYFAGVPVRSLKLLLAVILGGVGLWYLVRVTL
jgi:uncharacterized membrane protein YfcA